MSRILQDNKIGFYTHKCHVFTYTIMEKTSDWLMILTGIQQDHKPQNVIAKEAGCLSNCIEG